MKPVGKINGCFFANSLLKLHGNLTYDAKTRRLVSRSMKNTCAMYDLILLNVTPSIFLYCETDDCV